MIKQTTIYERDSEDEGGNAMSDTRTFSYQSERDIDEEDSDEMSEPDIAASVEKKS